MEFLIALLVTALTALVAYRLWPLPASYDADKVEAAYRTSAGETLPFHRGLLAGLGPLVLFVVQLLLNAAWTWSFFGLHRPGAALADIVLLWVALLSALILFWGLEPLAGILLVPYFAWVSFATALNWAIWRMNR